MNMKIDGFDGNLPMYQKLAENHQYQLDLFDTKILFLFIYIYYTHTYIYLFLEKNSNNVK